MNKLRDKTIYVQTEGCSISLSNANIVIKRSGENLEVPLYMIDTVVLLGSASQFLKYRLINMS